MLGKKNNDSLTPLVSSFAFVLDAEEKTKLSRACCSILLTMSGTVPPWEAYIGLLDWSNSHRK